MSRLRFGCTGAICIALIFASVGRISATQGTLPAVLSDAEFWKLTEDLSETSASSPLRADVLSRDLAVSVAARELAERVKPGGVYLGIGHEENYTYIAAMRPRIAFRDQDGREHSFLATEERFAFVKDLHSRNLIVPVVGGLAGANMMRGFGEFVRARSATVSAIYASRREAWPTQPGMRSDSCANIASLPFDASSVLIHPSRIADAVILAAIRGTRRSSPGPAGAVTAPSPQLLVRSPNPTVTPIAEELKTCR